MTGWSLFFRYIDGIMENIGKSSIYMKEFKKVARFSATFCF